ncbi:hypothetical protein QE386_001459 [Pseudoxanthomonas winnipegensis]|nr:hypothetical protein [Pseudoxanthomonas winnipegensis]
MQRLAIVVQQRDVEVARHDQLVHHAVHGGVELLQRGRGVGQLGDAEQRGLQLLGAAALLDLGLQLAVGQLQFAGARLDARLQLLVRVAPVQRGEDVLGHVAQQRAVLVGVAGRGVVALHHDRAADAVVAPHRHAQPVHAFRAMAGVQRHSQTLAHRRRRPAHRLAVVQQGQGHAVAHLLLAELALRIGHVGVDQIGEVEEAHRAAHLVVEHDVAVLRVHQRADHGVDAGQHLAHFQIGAGQVGDLVQRLLQALGLLQGDHAGRGPLGLEHGTDQRLGGGLPGSDLRRRQRRGQAGGQGHARIAFHVGPGQQQLVLVADHVLGVVPQRLLGAPAQCRAGAFAGRATGADRPVPPAGHDLRAVGQQAAQDLRHGVRRHGADPGLLHGSGGLARHRFPPVTAITQSRCTLRASFQPAV